MGQTQHPAALCKTHGIFPATAFSFAPGVNITLLGLSTTCPICGSISEILPGAYSAFKDRIDVLLDPSVSAEALVALRFILEAARDNKISQPEAKRQAEKIVPGSGRLFDIGNWGDQAKATLYASVIGAIALVTAAKLSASSSSTTVIQPVIERIIPMPQEYKPLPGLPGGNPLNRARSRNQKRR
ncbi:hypothetical protein [Hyphomicrobium sp. 99]|uniref:hypothetical protein n=1 Tax=Hyphomicrobium sp. 99 TaxID=1163419 RepID=UPI0012E06753|nr:hypothetical protein [Hyphomicrobium sp. 99]